MINKRQRDFDSLARAAKTAGLIGLGEITDFGTSTALGIAKTMQESTWEKKALVGGIIGNIAAHVLDMDLPFVNLGVESMQGIDAFVDNMSDVVMGAAGASLAYKTANNIQQIHNSNKSLEEILQDMGIEIEVEETPIKNNIQNAFAGMSPEQLVTLFSNQQQIKKPIEKEEKEFTEDEEKELLKKLLKKYGKEEIL